MNMVYDPVPCLDSAPISRASTPQLPHFGYALSGSAIEDTPPTSPASSTPPMLPVQALARLAFQDQQHAAVTLQHKRFISTCNIISYGVLAGVAYRIFGEGHNGASTILAWLILFVVMVIINVIWSKSRSSSVEETLPAQVMMHDPQTNTGEQTAAATLILLGYVLLAYYLYHYLNVLVLIIAAEFILVASAAALMNIWLGEKEVTVQYQQT